MSDEYDLNWLYSFSTSVAIPYSIFFDQVALSHFGKLKIMVVGISLPFFADKFFCAKNSD